MSLTRLLATLPEPLFSTYEIERVLGVGAYAVVYQIRDKLTYEPFALKVIEKEPLRIRLMASQLAREVSLLQAHTDTPHVVQLLETTMTGTHVFLRFELCTQSLEDMSIEFGPMSEEEAFSWLRQACLGVQGLHASGVIHRDLKPSNLLIDTDGALQICDFGWACTTDEALTGQCGTPEYSPPETSKTKGPIHTTKVDIYGLGVTLQHLLLGRVPQGPTDLPKGLSEATYDLFEELFESDPDLRPTVEDLLSRSQLSEGMITQLWKQWRSFFDVPLFVAPHHMQDGAVEVSCSLGTLH